MPPTALTYCPMSLRCLKLGSGAADAMQKVCETIGLFNAEYLAMSDIPINTHTHTHTHTHN